MARQANQEQKVAIEKTNGAILSAGAGSGKTFVIIEHLIFLIESKKNDFKVNSLEQDISQYLSKLVLMTFTKKAAGEMLVRLVNRVEEKIEEGDDLIFWEIVQRNLNLMQISTIHGFCHRLISLNIWPHLPANIKLLSNTAHENKIRKLATYWFNSNQHKLDELYLSQASDLYVAMLEIFKSPELRVLWERGQIKKDLNEELDSFINSYLELNPYEHIFDVNNFRKYSEENLKKQGFELLNKFAEIISTSGRLNSKNINLFYELFEGYKRFPSETKDMESIDCILRNEIKQLHEFLKKIKVDYVSLIENFEKYVEWESILFEMFNSINHNYLTIPGFSFSDLEYYVYKGLESDSAREEISKRYKYFIVDEFQDTSFLQFDIIKKLINFDTSKLFCVGDKKQAIYGFRGGELQVFSECQDLMGPSSNLHLLSNYRSENEVINFNNELFDFLLPLGTGFSGVDSHSVEMEKQITPLEKISGKVCQINVNSKNEHLGVNQIESLGIVKLLEELNENDKIESIAILYRMLKPSHLLIDLLKNKKISFSAQVKISLDDDPIINLFMHFVRCLVNEKDQKRFDNSIYFIKTILEILDVDFNLDILRSFIDNTSTFGLYYSFYKALVDLSISNSLFEENMKLIEEICVFTKNDPLHILKMINKNEGNYSFEMITDSNKKIYILSAHASKGLEYDVVILGGIHTNGRYEGMNKKIGSYPKSFKWKSSFDQRSYFKSLNYYIESEVNKLKDFAESKRLFYVACTRAVKELYYFNISINNELQLKFENSWINGLRTFEQKNIIEISMEVDENAKISPPVTYFLKDNLGVISTFTPSRIGIVSELSVTRLATIAECPFKFYLKNICKLEPQLKLDFDQDDDEEFYSSKSRGSEIHYQISQSLSKKNIAIKKEFEAIVAWVNSEISKINPDEIISEKEMKFSFFGQMITAIPDLVLVKNDSFEVWDFKTGRYDNATEISYFFQLKTYAYGIYKLNKIDQLKDCLIKLVYVDEKKIISKALDFNTIENELRAEWLKTDCFSRVSKDHCPHCEYSYMCKFSSAVESN